MLSAPVAMIILPSVVEYIKYNPDQKSDLNSIHEPRSKTNQGQYMDLLLRRTDNWSLF